MPRAPSAIKAVLLAGGLGTRLRPYTFFLPKPMLPVGDTPILERIIAWLAKEGLREVVVSTGYLGSAVEQYFGNGSSLGVKIEYARAEGPLGIAGQLKSAERYLGRTFVCLYGDAILDFDLRRLLAFHREKGAILTMALMTHRVEEKYGVIDLEGDGRIRDWREKPVLENRVNIGCYVMDRRYLAYIPHGSTYGMKEAFDAAMKAGEPLYGLTVGGTFIDIGDKQAYREADAVISRGAGTPD